MINKVILIGRLGAEPELRKMQNGDSVCNLSLATSENWKSKDGERKESTEWHRVVLFGKVADIAGQYTNKGSMVYIEGKIKTRKWQDQSGQDKYSTEIIVQGFDSKFQLMDSKKDGQSSHNQAKADGYQPQGGYDDMEDDIPFMRISDRIMA